jgi:hypothetical protein
MSTHTQLSKMLCLLVIATTGMFSVSEGLAAQPDQQAVEATETKQVNPNKRVCKRVKPTGSHLYKRVCMKKKEWDAMAKAAREDMRNLRSDRRGGFSK